MRTRVALVVVCLVAVVLPAGGPAGAQVRPVYDIGAAGLVQLLERLQTTASVLHTGAHPDDEDSSFIARMARGDHARVAYLSLNRGEGGQNIIGTELFDALGVIRTEELLQARRLDGGEQFFTRSFDYGFSKTRDEAAAKWNEREVLGDMVRVIRTFRPLVIYARFSGTPADGHGQHQMAGYLTPLAFRAAGDPTQFPEQIAEGLRPWQAKKSIAARRSGSIPRTRRPSTCRPASWTRRSAAPTPRSRPRGAASTSRRRWAASADGAGGIWSRPVVAAAGRPRRTRAFGVRRHRRRCPTRGDSGLPADRCAASWPPSSRRGRRSHINRSILSASCRCWPTVCRLRAARRPCRRSTRARCQGRRRISCSRRRSATLPTRSCARPVSWRLSDAETVTPGGWSPCRHTRFSRIPASLRLPTPRPCPAGWRAGRCRQHQQSGRPQGRREQPTAETRTVTVDSPAPR